LFSLTRATLHGLGKVFPLKCGVQIRFEPRGKKHLKARDTPMAISHARQASAFDDDAFLRLVWAVPSPD
jgi:hypothetical protein